MFTSVGKQNRQGPQWMPLQCIGHRVHPCGSLGTSPARNIALRVQSQSLPQQSFLPSKQCLIPKILLENCSWNKFVPPLFHGKSFFFPSSPKEAPGGISIVASTHPLASVIRVPVLPLPVRTLTQNSGGKERRNSSWGGKEGESLLQTTFYWECNSTVAITLRDYIERLT